MSTLKSTVSLLAIDQRVLLLKSGNDLSLREVYEELSSYNILDNIAEILFGGQFLTPWFWPNRYQAYFNVELL
jgi:hypothetical protein